MSDASSTPSVQRQEIEDALLEIMAACARILSAIRFPSNEDDASGR